MHVEALEWDTWPRGHGAQYDDPVYGEYVPGGQISHVMPLVDTVPAGQGVQSLAKGPEVVPALHGMHRRDPPGACVPAGQGRQVMDNASVAIE